MPYLMRFCVPQENEFHNTWRNFVCDINNTTWNFSLEILSVFHFSLFCFSIHTSSRDIKSFVRYLHMQRQLHLLTIWECWKEKLRYTIVFSTAILCHTDAAAAAYVWTFLLLCKNTTPIFLVDKENELGRKMICSLNLNVLWNLSNFRWAIVIDTTIGFGIHNSLDIHTFSTPKKSSVFNQCSHFSRGL